MKHYNELLKNQAPLSKIRLSLGRWWYLKLLLKADNIELMKRIVVGIKNQYSIKMKLVRYRFLWPYLKLRDLVYISIFKRNMLPLHKQLHGILNNQKQAWPSHIYAGGYFYQGWLKIGIKGLRETNTRFADYNISSYMSLDKKCLDIGSNNGFFALKLGELNQSVDAIEFNPFLIEIGETTAKYLDINNVNFIKGDFQEYEFKKRYDYVFSLANHQTADNNLNIEMRQYCQMIYNLLNVNGCLMFESHTNEVNIKQYIEIFSDLFVIEQEALIKQYKINYIGDRLFYVLRKVEI